MTEINNEKSNNSTKFLINRLYSLKDLLLKESELLSEVKEKFNFLIKIIFFYFQTKKSYINNSEKIDSLSYELELLEMQIQEERLKNERLTFGL